MKVRGMGIMWYNFIDQYQLNNTYMIIALPFPKFKEIESKLSIHTIPEGYVNDYIILNNRKYVAVGGCGNGKGTGWEYFWIHEIIPISIYDGMHPPLTYSEHNRAVELKKRERGYTGILVNCDKILHVFVGELITVECSKSEKQLEIF